MVEPKPNALVRIIQLIVGGLVVGVLWVIVTDIGTPEEDFSKTKSGYACDTTESMERQSLKAPGRQVVLCKNMPSITIMSPKRLHAAIADNYEAEYGEFLTGAGHSRYMPFAIFEPPMTYPGSIAWSWRLHPTSSNPKYHIVSGFDQTGLDHIRLRVWTEDDEIDHDNSAVPNYAKHPGPNQHPCTGKYATTKNCVLALFEEGESYMRSTPKGHCVVYDPIYPMNTGLIGQEIYSYTPKNKFKGELGIYFFELKHGERFGKWACVAN